MERGEKEDNWGRDEKVLKEIITERSGTGRAGAEIDLWPKVSLLFSLHSPEQWDCRRLVQRAIYMTYTNTHTHTQMHACTQAG